MNESLSPHCSRFVLLNCHIFKKGVTAVGKRWHLCFSEVYLAIPLTGDDDTDDENEEPFKDEDDDEEEEEHLAPADSPAIPIVDPIPSVGDTKAFTSRILSYFRELMDWSRIDSFTIRLHDCWIRRPWFLERLRHIPLAALGQIQALQARDQTHADDREGAASTAVGLVFPFLVSDNHNNMPPRRSSATVRVVAAAARAAAAAATPMTAAAVEQLIEARVSAALANHETLRNSTNGQGDGSHNSDTGTRGTGTEGVVVLSQWFEKMESVFHISNCAVENQVKFATCTFLGNALTWWNSHMKTVTQDVAYAMD
ncbi:hypothetical protein Tco_0514297 [Tanacetum coccineum]